MPEQQPRGREENLEGVGRGCMERGRYQEGAAPAQHCPALKLRLCLAPGNLGASRAGYSLAAGLGD